MVSKAPIAVLGAGAWGTALALVLAESGDLVYLWARDPAQASAIGKNKRNEKYLPNITLPANIKTISDLDLIGTNLHTVLMAVPFQQSRALLRMLKAQKKRISGIVWASKGIELASHSLAHEIVMQELGAGISYAVLSGPNFAREVAERKPAAVTIASADPDFSGRLCERFHTSYFRPYSTDDVAGVEIGGAIKNVMAIAAGIADGLALGANARAALVTRGLAEIARWGALHGGRLETFMGLSGLGDLVLTATDDSSRNRRFGLALARGASVDQATAEIGLVEGAKTALALADLARQKNISMPISSQVAAVVRAETSAKDAVQQLLSRDIGEE